MTISCPACRADNSDRTCRRCKADLGMLFDLESSRDEFLASARRLMASDATAALASAESARALRDGPDAARLIASARLLNRDFQGAYASWSAGKK